MSRLPKGRNDDRTYRDLGRVLLFLRTFHAFRGRWFSIKEVHEVTRLPMSTCHYNMQGFVYHGVLEYEPTTQKYRARREEKK